MSEPVQPRDTTTRPPAGDEGYMLLGLIVAIAVLLLWLAVAATTEAFAIRREREVETARRADQYVRAIRLFYRKFGHYPGSIEQLEKTNNIRFLRRRWIDPLTGVEDWRTIEVGKNQTTPRAFFGEPLAGLPTSGLGALAGSLSPGMPGSPAAGATPGASAPGAPGSSPTGFAPTNANPSSAIFGTGSAPGAPAGGEGNPSAPASAVSGVPNASGSPGAAGAAGTPATGSPGSAGGSNPPAGAFMGIGTNAMGNSILEVNGQTTYQTWEFLYDPRVEQLRAIQQANSGVQSTPAGSLGQQPNSSAPPPGTPFGQPQNPSAPPGSSPFGQPQTPNGPGVPPPISSPQGIAPQGTANPNGTQTPIIGIDTPNQP